MAKRRTYSEPEIYSKKRYNQKTLIREREYGFYWYSWIWHLARPVLIFLCAMVVVVGLAANGWFYVYDHMLKPVNPQDSDTVTFKIAQGDSISTIASNLVEQHLLRSETLFKYSIMFNGLTSLIHYGDYQISPNMDANQIISLLTSGSDTAERTITIIPGWTVTDIAAYFVKIGALPNANEFLQLCNDSLTFKNYYTILTGHNFLLYFRNTFVVVVLSLTLILIFSSLAAYALANWKTKLSHWVFLFIIAGMMLPIRIASIRLLEIIRALGLDNTMWSLPPVYLAMSIPIGVFILTGFVRQIPHELIEAGFVDGAGHGRIFLTIIVPMLRPALATVGIYNLVPIWNDLWFPLIFITRDSDKTLILGVQNMFGQYFTDWSKVLALLTLSALPVILLYLSMSKQFIKGLTAGALKG